MNLSYIFLSFLLFHRCTLEKLANVLAFNLDNYYLNNYI